MDLIRICDRAKEAGIDIDIRINTGIFLEPHVTIQGSTHEEDYYDRKKYAVRYSLRELKEAKVYAEDIIERATDKIIENLCPMKNENTLSPGDWDRAILSLLHMMPIYAFDKTSTGFEFMEAKKLYYRYKDGERTRELYDEIMALK